ncbi:MAG: hypothetical protein IPG17_02780 [Sandaracinaceae bacterium]|nr:hypothetical protein [Sandaracinaceae bacterium]
MTHLVWVGEHLHHPRAVAWARYEAGRGYTSLGDPAAAIAQFEALERQAPTRTAGRRRPLRARPCWTSVAPGVPRPHERAATRYPSGGTVEARWGSWPRGRARRDFAAGGSTWTRPSRAHRHGRQRGAWGRSAYWLARTLHDLELRSDAPSRPMRASSASGR